MTNQEIDSHSQSEIDQLVRRTGAPLAVVQELYRVERDKIEQTARIKTFVSVLTHRRVKAVLELQRGNRH